jgi:hypothetical protein
MRSPHAINPQRNLRPRSRGDHRELPAQFGNQYRTPAPCNNEPASLPLSNASVASMPLGEAARSHSHRARTVSHRPAAASIQNVPVPNPVLGRIAARVAACRERSVIKLQNQEATRSRVSRSRLARVRAECDWREDRRSSTPLHESAQATRDTKRATHIATFSFRGLRRFCRALMLRSLCIAKQRAPQPALRRARLWRISRKDT